MRSNPRVLRGGSWVSSTKVCCSAYRLRNSPDLRFINLGFRVLLKKKNPLRVLRGGCWDGNGGGCRSAYSYGYGPGYRGSTVGFRLILKPTKQ